MPFRKEKSDDIMFLKTIKNKNLWLYIFKLSTPGGWKKITDIFLLQCTYADMTKKS